MRAGGSSHRRPDRNWPGISYYTWWGFGEHHTGQTQPHTLSTTTQLDDDPDADGTSI